MILYLLNYMEDDKVIASLERKMGPPLGELSDSATPRRSGRRLTCFSPRLSVTLLSSGPEVQYVALRNILLIIQRRPAILQNEVKVFFCKYNDPIYVKLAKLEIMYRLARDNNFGEVLEELKE